MVRLPSIKSLKRRAWTAFAKWTRTRDRRCITCGSPTTEAGHFIHNSDKINNVLGGNALWYDERNINGQCTYCNCYRGGRLDVYAEKLEQKYGYGIIQELRKLYQTPKKWTREDLSTVALKYENMLEFG